MSFEDLEAGKPLASVSNMQDPSQAVAAAVFQIHTAVSTFQRLVNTLGTPRDTLDLRERLNGFVNVYCLLNLPSYCDGYCIRNFRRLKFQEVGP